MNENKKRLEDTVREIEKRISAQSGLDAARKSELLKLLATLREEVADLSVARSDEAESIARFAAASAHEATRQGKSEQLQSLSIQALSSSVEGFEASHPKLVRIVNALCVQLSDLGI
ncbi:MAG: DUF4404 family protein [Lentisphaerae bacterium]|nr:DUF4404 family protein [Lentisphaerota bacterium]